MIEGLSLQNLQTRKPMAKMLANIAKGLESKATSFQFLSAPLPSHLLFLDILQPDFCSENNLTLSFQGSANVQDPMATTESLLYLALSKD